MKQLLLLAYFAGFTRLIGAQEVDSSAAPNGFQFSGNIDAYGRWSANGTASTTHFPALEHKSLDWGWANLATEWRHRRWYALVDVAWGPRAKAFSGAEWYHALQQYSLSYKVSKPCTITAGYFYFPFNYEYPQAGMNMNYSYSILYSIIPVSYNGLKLDWAISDNLAAWAAVFGDPNVRDGAFHPHPAFGFEYTKGNFTGYFNFLTGKDGGITPNTSAEVIAEYQITDKLTAVLETEIFSTKTLGEPALGFNSWVGYLQYAFSERYALAARGEWFNDRDGYVFGETDNGIAALTVSPKVQFGNFIIQPEIRYEHASRAIFPTNSGDTVHRDTHVLLALIYKFGKYPE